MNHMSVLDIIVNLIAASAFLGFITFVVIYSGWANWRITSAGRSLLYAMSSLCLVLLLNTVHLFTGPYPGIEFVRMPIYIILSVSAWRLVVTLIKILTNGSTMSVESLYKPKREMKETNVFVKVQNYAKFIVAILGAVASTGSLLIPEDWGKYITFAVAVATAIAVYKVPNTTVGVVETLPTVVPVDTKPEV